MGRSRVMRQTLYFLGLAQGVGSSKAFVYEKIIIIILEAKWSLWGIESL